MTARILAMVITENPQLERMTFSLLQDAQCAPLVPAADESALAAMRRLKPHAVLVDCEHPAAVSDRFFELADAQGIGILVYGRETREADVELIAQQQNVCKLLLPVDGSGLAEAVQGAMVQ